MDAIHLGPSAETYIALSEYMFRKGICAEFEAPWVLPENLALFIEVAKRWPDDASIFPKGKWAMIQYLEGLLDEAIWNELTR